MTFSAVLRAAAVAAEYTSSDPLGDGASSAVLVQECTESPADCEDASACSEVTSLISGLTDSHAGEHGFVEQDIEGLPAAVYHHSQPGLLPDHGVSKDRHLAITAR